MTATITSNRISGIDGNQDDPLLRLDCGHLMIENIHFASNEQQEHLPLTEVQLKDISREPIQQLVHTLFQLPSRRIDTRVVIELPPTKTLLPREHSIPQMKSLTKWEEFAKTKGILKRKRSRMIWDESSEQWKPRYGYQRTHKNMDNSSSWLEEVANDKDLDFDPFIEKTRKRTQRLVKNQNQMMKNQEHVTRPSNLPLSTIKESSKRRRTIENHTPKPNYSNIANRNTNNKSHSNGGGDGDDLLPGGLNLLDQWNSRTISKQSKKSTLHHMIDLSRKSTASLGRYIRPIEGESPKSTRRFQSHHGSSVIPNDLSSEKKTSLAILDRVLKTTSKIPTT